MSQDFSITQLVLSTQRTELEVSARELELKMSTAHAADTGVQAPVGRTSLREMLEGAIGETHALVQIAQDDVQKIAGRLLTLETQTADLDLRLGAGWEDLPL
ncbi:MULTISPECIES: hypothetical protein [unclassified Microbacterium]|uniref:hypothetical protein n=1 Tax=unclassified Microbacterium TaxID=2609290 RepID=UPI000CFE1998|nr:MULTISPECIES: hypothetical protein [unclassified Microbacterium]PQZ54783.1 hypothetical protein CQ032_12750 [Microbacterium sp. MYb43]PQZ77526.1 hypothetical protein CQ031_11450 [Microbacterium sp. MYb40]PRB19794.1 hypothetical protein CQ040_14390 [Microbacterium sp. MYb54]PRB25834.1 hypothetical protein CQ037_13930 [Microbacterium sp. MYb50]PRB64328.1 hypothetical protein CQ021_14360 [Microbacterium sp. MYb24]